MQRQTNTFNQSATGPKSVHGKTDTVVYASPNSSKYPTHCTRFNGYTSDLLDVNASFVQGSAIGPGMYVVNAGYLQVVTPGKGQQSDEVRRRHLYLVIPACNVDSRDKEISNVDEWSRSNNLTLNHTKSVEVIFRDSRKRCCIHPPSPLQGIARVTSLKVLDVTLTDRLSVTAHVDDVVGSSACAVHVCY